MNGASPTSPPQSDEHGSSPSKVKVLKVWLFTGSVALAFLAGFFPLWLKAGRAERKTAEADKLLRLSQLQLTIANAALDARRGEYEKARQGASDFFTLTRAELDRSADSALSAGARPEVQKLLVQRDALITLLARGDPASAERLANFQAAFRSATGQ